MQTNKLDPNQETILGINAAYEIIKTRPNSVKLLSVLENKSSKRIIDLIVLANKSNIKILKETKSYFANNYGEQNHQGIAVTCNVRSHEGETYLDQLIEKSRVCLLILDHITDPHNVGACIRSASAAGVDAVIVPKDRACHLTPTVRKISSGATELIPFIVVTNLSRTIKKISSKGIKVMGATIESNTNYLDADMTGSAALVIGSEDKGLKSNIAKNCDILISINMPGKIDSLNASVSSGILLFEYLRQNNHAI